MVTSATALKSAASSAVTSSIEKKLQSYLTKAGITEGNMSITFNEDKSFTVERSDKQVASGTYTIDDDEVSLTFKGRSSASKLTPQLDNGTLVLVADATQIKTLFENLGSNISQLSTLTSLTKSMDGMKIGIRLSK